MMPKLPLLGLRACLESPRTALCPPREWRAMPPCRLLQALPAAGQPAPQILPFGTRSSAQESGGWSGYFGQLPDRMGCLPKHPGTVYTSGWGQNVSLQGPSPRNLSGHGTHQNGKRVIYSASHRVAASRASMQMIVLGTGGFGWCLRNGIKAEI